MRGWVKGLFIGLIACWASLSTASDRIEVVVSFSILGDMVKQVGGERVTVRSLVGPDTDSHVYQPTPADGRAIKAAKLVVVNGLGFDEWMNRLIGSTGYRGRVVVASNGVKPLAAADRHGHRHGSDPHAWQSIPNVVVYVDNIEKALIAVDPTHADAYRKNATRYRSTLKAVDADLLRRFTAIPVDRRRILTSHDAFAYFGKRYGIAIIALTGVSPEVEPSAASLAKIMEQVKASKVRALFVENISDDRLLRQVTKETGIRIGGKLYSDALSGPQGQAATYVDLMRHNAKQIIDALDH